MYLSNFLSWDVSDFEDVEVTANEQNKSTSHRRGVIERDNNTYEKCTRQTATFRPEGSRHKMFHKMLLACDCKRLISAITKPKMSLDHKNINFTTAEEKEDSEAGKAPGTLQRFCLQSWWRSRENEGIEARHVVDIVTR